MNPVREQRLSPNRRCRKCNRIGEKAQFKPGPLTLVDGETVRTWECQPKCVERDNTHLETAKPPDRAQLVPPYLGHADPPPPKRGTAERLLTPPKPKARQPKGSRAEFQVKRDLVRMVMSASATSSYARSVTKNKEHPEGQDPMNHPHPKSQVRVRKQPLKGRK